ncbi:MAG: glycosyltransferase [Desulfobacterales bacterium]
MTLTRLHKFVQGGYRVQSSKPLVTALICNYNYGRFVAEAIDSALAQTYSSLEVIVVDDGSTDDSHEVLHRYSGRIRIILKENGGQASAFNVGISEAHGEIICFLDSDDIWHPEKVEKVVCKYLEAPWGLVCHDMTIIDGKGASIRGMNYTEFTRGRLPCGELLDTIIDEGFPYVFSPTSGLSLPVSIARLISPLPETEWRICADTPLAYAATCHAPVGVIDSTLGSYRIHSKNSFAAIYEDIVSGLVFNVVHPARRYFFLRNHLDSLGQVLSKTPKENYRYFRRCCFIACKYPWRNVTRLLKMNIIYFSQKYNWFAAFLSPVFLLMDILILLSIQLSLPSKYKKARMRFQMEANNIEPLINAFLTEQ